MVNIIKVEEICWGSFEALTVLQAVEGDETDWIFGSEEVDLLEGAFEDREKVLLEVLVVG